MATNEVQMATLLQRMRQMCAADISVLEAAANTPGSSITTGPGSANESLWTEMAALGWMSVKDDVLDLPGGKQFVVRIYSITPDGSEPILKLLSALMNR
jgi:hypothetical protein